ncbi:hypothetical protein GLOIN_2v719779 [Rhizophagus clarus]|uniref:K Homology domain-containing protein n=1 Tax=Rhizophagus clarus TaxID=94130 RepID=A0A8H3LEW1_9GLOM|nr:hypothetical protein GLOIN_2v719779 [Rhizophagus clarus]
MEKQTQNLFIPIPHRTEIDKLIGREGCNLKPITERTGTYTYIDKETNSSQIKYLYDEENENVEVPQTTLTTTTTTTNTVNEDLPEKFSKTIFKEKRNKDKLKRKSIKEIIKRNLEFL